MTGTAAFWERLLGAPARAAVHRPWRALALAGALGAVAALLVSTRLELRTSNLDLVDPELPEVARFRALAAEFGTPNPLVVALEGEPAALGSAVDRAAAAIAGGPGVRAVVARLPFREEVLLPLGQEPYFRSRDGGMALLFVQPADADSAAATIAPFVEGVRRAVAGLGLEREGIRAGFTGLPQYALDDRDFVRRDISRLSGISFVVVLAIFAFGQRRLREPLLAMAVLALAALGTAGLAAIAPGHLTLVSAFFFSILFGLGIDFGIHVADRAAELRREGLEPGEAVVGGVIRLAPGLGTGAVTTAGSFLLLGVSGLRGFAELGLLAAAGILLSLAAMVTVYPALLVLWPGRAPAAPGRFAVRLAAVQHPALAAALVGASLAVLAFGAPEFDGDYLDLQPHGSATVRLEREIVARSGYATQFAAFVVPDSVAAAELVERLAAEPTVGEVRSAAAFEPLLALEAQIPGEWERFRSLYVGSDGREAVYAFPAGDVWEPVFQERFLARMRALDPEVTGMPFLGRFLVERSRQALRRTSWLAVVMLVALVAADLTNPWRAALAVTPAFLAVGAMLGGMRLLGLDFNPINVLALPIVLGVAEDSGVHLVHRFVAERGDLARTMGGAGRSILVCGATTLAGFGALAFAEHRGLASFAIALSLGVGSALALSLLALPTLMRLAGRRLLAGEPPPAASG